MKASFPTNHNYYAQSPLVSDAEIEDNFTDTGKKSKTIQREVFANNFELTTKDESLKQLKIFRFKPQKNKLDDDEQLILKLYKRLNSNNQCEHIVQTGLFAGVVYHNGCEFSINCAYGKAFLQRMLNFLNDVYVDTKEVKADKNTETNPFQHILAHLFVHGLERSAALGLPQVYQPKTQRSHKVRGSVDINAYLRQDMPFQGKLTTTFKEQSYVQEVIDVLYLACEKLKKSFGVMCLHPILNLYQMLKSQYSGRFVNQAVIDCAKNHRALHNPMFRGFRRALEFAEIILNDWDLQNKDNSDKQTYGYLFDISQLFEVYLEKLLSHHFLDWAVSGQEQLTLYASRFYARNMYPDLVLKHLESDKVIVLDAKFKKMRFAYQDLDRNDFYQIHTYMQHYGSDLLFGGLIYPLSEKHNSENAYSETLFDCADSKNNQPRFIVDGLELAHADNEDTTIEDIINSEKQFLQRLQELIDESLIIKTEKSGIYINETPQNSY